jgi:hypothetical protein
MANTFDLERVNHSDAYSFLDGVHVNGAESYFARLRRMIRGQHHRVGVGSLGGYAAHAAWLEDHRRQSTCRPGDREWFVRAGQPALEGLLATRRVMAGPAAQMHIPLRFSTMTTILRRVA